MNPTAQDAVPLFRFKRSKACIGEESKLGKKDLTIDLIEIDPQEVET